MGRGTAAGRVVYGLHPVRELLRSDQPVEHVEVAAGREPSRTLDDIVARAAERGVAVTRVARDRLDTLAGSGVHQGVVATAPAFPYRRLDQLRWGDEPALMVALDGVTDPHNLGSVARTAEAVGAHGLLVPGRRAAPVTAAAEKAAAGALAHLPVVRVTNLVRALGDLAASGVWSVGLDAAARDAVHACRLLTEAVVLVVGAEDVGLSRLVRDRCDALVRLPMRGRVSSLNASVAAAVALYAVVQSRAQGHAGPRR